MTKILFLLTAVLITFNSNSQIDPNKVGTTQKFDEVLTYITRMYVDTVNNDQLTDAAIIAMLEKLDPHSTYITKGRGC